MLLRKREEKVGRGEGGKRKTGIYTNRGGKLLEKITREN